MNLEYVFFPVLLPWHWMPFPPRYMSLAKPRYSESSLYSLNRPVIFPSTILSLFSVLEEIGILVVQVSHLTAAFAWPDFFLPSLTRQSGPSVSGLVEDPLPAYLWVLLLFSHLP